eukprot:CAMPEP_0118937776 /NCGR_PEP_ID=MMETSP1169-20130426/23797_1 /TAXON_ID=36882 /ORGANISM="Pyramimonas obovata, Strain CCMP722" /LENGTH=166 /DNA_ID=CAMNT_0006881521 /DNA_START=213 /DNA_END=709 /DNA_ORIENTATION=+
MPRGDDLDEIKKWRLLACFLWQFVWNLPAVCLWAIVAAPSIGSLLSFRMWVSVLLFSVLQVPVILVQVSVMIPSPAQTTLFGKQLSPTKLWKALFSSKPAVPPGKQTSQTASIPPPKPPAPEAQVDPWAFAFANALKEVFRVVCFLTACAASGAASVTMLRWVTHG